MPIEIIPRKKLRIPAWQIIFFSISLISILITISIFFAFNQSEKKDKAKIEELKTLLEKEKTQEIKEREDELIFWQEKIKTFSELMEGHFFASNIFGFLEKTSHPKVIYTRFELNPAKNTLDLNGQTDNFVTLGQQVFLLRGDSRVENLNLSKISLTKTGKVDFTFEISLKPEIFQWAK